MGKEEIKGKTSPRVVLDTNVFISSVLFYGPPSKFVTLWQQDDIVLLVSSEVLKEYLRVLSYPKFRLTKKEIQSLIEVEVMPFVEPVRVRTELQVIKRDPTDNKFLELAVDGKAEVIVSSDKHLLELGTYEGIKIVSVSQFMKRLK